MFRIPCPGKKSKWIAAGIVTVPALLFAANLFWGKPVFIRHFFYREMLKNLSDDPQLVTKVKVPLLHTIYRDDLNDLSPEKADRQHRRMHQAYKTLKKYDEKSLNEEDLFSKKLMEWHLQQDIEGIPFAHYSFFINPFNGHQNLLPAYLDTYHRIEHKADAKAYLKRLEKFPEYFDQVIKRSELARKKGIMPPRHLIHASIQQMKEFIGVKKEQHFLFTSFMQKIGQQKKISNPEKYLDKALDLLESKVYPSYLRLIAYEEKMLAFAPEESNATLYPDGDAYYSYLIRYHTGMDLSAEEIHAFGRNEIARIRLEMNEVLDQIYPNKYISDPLDEIRKLKINQKYIYQNDQRGRDACLNDFDSILQTVGQRLPEWFDELPSSRLQVKRVPEFKETASSFAYYEVAQMGGDGSGTFYVRLDDLSQKPRFGMPTLAYHEGWPGHHLQLALHLENKKIPLYDKRFTNNGFIEGWALYAERLMFEADMYKNKPEENLGRLEAEIMRAARLVVDTGIHHYGWNKKRASEYMFENTAMFSEEVATEIDRYISDPGQALAYTLGFHGLLKLRDKAKKAAGDNFDLKAFHQIILSRGIPPMQLLEEFTLKYYVEKSAKR